MIDDADIVAELRYHGSDMGLDAAKEIERLRTENTRLRGLLREAIQDPDRVTHDGTRQYEIVVTDEWYSRVRAALEGKS